MAGEAETATIEENDDAFNAGFTDDDQTTTPGPEPESTEETGEKTVEEAPIAEPEPAPKLAQITEEQFKALMAKADEVDQIRSDSKRQIDTLAGHLGGMKQLVDGLKQQRSQMTPGQFKRVTAEFPEIGRLLEEDLSELGGTAGQAIDPAEIDRRAQAIVAQELPKELVKMEVKLLRSYHRDWVEVVRSQEFSKWSQTLPPEQQQQLMGNDGEFIADRITDFKAAQAAAAEAAKAAEKTPAKPAPVSTRQRQLEAAVTPKSASGNARATAGVDPFDEGFNEG